MQAGNKPSDRFVIERKLGTGGMGVVQLAYDNERGCQVALKYVGPCDNADVSEGRLQREGEILKMLDHPGIVKCLGPLKINGQYVLLQDFVDGFTFRQWFNRLLKGPDGRAAFDSLLNEIPEYERDEEMAWLNDEAEGDEDQRRKASDDRAPLPLSTKELIESDIYIRQCCELVRQAAAALGHAHDKGVIHRDLKPENVMIDRDGRARIIDFGVSRFQGATTLSRSGRVLLGTLRYMSPEQTTGPINVDQRSDVYSLGIVLYEALTLRRPYSAWTSQGFLLQLVTRPIPPVIGGNRAIPRDLEAVVHMATARDPAKRYKNGGMFEQDLARFLEGKPVAARPYRYKPDRSEIAAKRPLAITVSAWLFLFLSSVWFLTILASLTLPPVFGRDRVVRILTAIVLGALGFLSVFLGRGLLRASPAAMVLAAVMAVGVALLSLFFFVDALQSEPFSIFSAIMFCVFALIGTFILCAISLTRTRTWVRDAQRILLEQKQPPETTF